MENLFEVIFRIFGLLLFLLVVSFFSFAKRRSEGGQKGTDTRKKARLAVMKANSFESYENALSDVLSGDAKREEKQEDTSISLSDAKTQTSHHRHQDSFEKIQADRKEPAFFLEKGMDGQENLNFISPLQKLDERSYAFRSGGGRADLKKDSSMTNSWQLKASQQKLKGSVLTGSGFAPKKNHGSYALMHKLRRKNGLKEAIIIKEILSKPLALQGYPERKI